MDALVALGDHGPHAQKRAALGRPVARAARPVLLAGDHHQRHAVGLVAHRRVVDRQLLAVGEVPGEAALDALDDPVSQPDVREGAAHHHLVVAAPRAVAVELARLDAVLDQVAAGGCGRRDRPGRRDVVGRDRVAQDRQHPRVHDVGQVGGALEEGGLPHVGRVRIPLEQLAGRHRQLAPALVAVEDAAVLVGVELGCRRRRPRPVRPRRRSARARRASPGCRRGHCRPAGW